MDYKNEFFSTDIAHHGHFYFKQMKYTDFEHLGKENWKFEIMNLEKNQYHNFGATEPTDDDLNDLNEPSFKA